MFPANKHSFSVKDLLMLLRDKIYNYTHSHITKKS